MSINQQTETVINLFSSTVYKVAPYKKATQKEKQISLSKKPWLIYGLLKSIKKNAFYHA